ncbi:hypothetical protein DRE_00008 [Drechslerella stenobrocha 248]|uniref:Uncharacterized protein n=1 Tax=Drechslerella stenobrocha 248 TaxID=1043628 RepID=W7I8R6_9PEZI|nr:hypothetical protein DRE_00008 [Drechslerella stenobrocha 248]
MPPMGGPHRRTHQRTPALTRSPSADSSSDSSTSTTNTVVSSSQGVIRPSRNHEQGAGYFEPSLTTASQVAAATAVARESARKHSQSDPSPPSTAGGSSPMPLSAAGAAALAAMPKMDRGPSSGAEREKEKEKKESKMKIFSKPLRAAQSDKTKNAEQKPLPSPSKLGTPLPRIPSSVSNSDGSRRPSFTSTISDTLYSSSPPTSSHSHKHHLLLRGRKEQPLSSANSNSKLISEGSSIYNFNPSSPSAANFAVSTTVTAGQKTLVTNADIKHVVGVVSGKDKDAAGDQVLEEVWPLLKSRVLPLFAGEGLRTPVEDLNKLVIVHIKRQVEKKAAILLIDDVQTLLDHGMALLDNASSSLSKLTELRLIPRLVELWNFVFSTVLPYFEAVFLPLQQEFKGIGTVLSPREARELWGAADQRLDLRRMTLTSYRDTIILPLYSRLHSENGRAREDDEAQLAEPWENRKEPARFRWNPSARARECKFPEFQPRAVMRYNIRPPPNQLDPASQPASQPAIQRLPQMAVPTPSVCIAISGPSSSGKTSLARLLRSAFTSTAATDGRRKPISCTILHGDDFYIPDSQLPLVELGSTGQTAQDWDCPEALDFTRFLASVQHAKAHGQLPNDHVSYEVTHAVGVEENIARFLEGGGDGGNSDGNSNSVKDTVADLERRAAAWLQRVEERRGGQLENVVIVDGFLLFGSGVPEALKDEFDIKLMIRTPYAKAKKRREDREGYTTVEGFWHDPPGYFELLVWPAYVKQHSYLYQNGDMDAGVLTHAALENGIRTPQVTDQTLIETLEWAVGALESTKLDGGYEET